MNQISKDQILKRWDSLPDNLREALWSSQNSAIIEHICVGEHIPENKINAVSKIAGHVLMGFLHPEEAKTELQDQLQLPPQLAQKIADDLNARIFTSFRADLDKVYAPPGAEPVAFPNLGEAAPLGIPVQLPQPKVMEEIKAPFSPPKPSGAQPPTGPAPVFLRKESEFTPVQATPGLRLELPGQKTARAEGAQTMPGGFRPSSLPLTPAKLEIGGKPYEAPKPGVGKTEISAPRVVHYESTLRTPLTPGGTPKPTGSSSGFQSGGTPSPVLLHELPTLTRSMPEPPMIQPTIKATATAAPAREVPPLAARSAFTPPTRPPATTSAAAPAPGTVTTSGRVSPFLNPQITSTAKPTITPPAAAPVRSPNPPTPQASPSGTLTPPRP